MRFILTICVLAANAATADVVILDHVERVVVRYDRSYALLVGVSDYTAGWDDLPSVPGELAQVEEVLEEHGFAVTKVLDPTEAELRRAFEDFIDEHGVDASHRLLVFFAGHGYSRDLPTGRRGYLVPADAPRPTADLKGFLRKAVPMTQVETWARNIEAKHTLFVFDSCFSGAVLDVRGGEPPQPSAITAKMGRSVRQFLTAGSAGEEVPGKSVFTPAFVRALRGEADLVPDGYVTGTELGVFLDQKVRYPGQTPQFGRLRGYHEGDFVFHVGLKDVGLKEPPEIEFDISDLRARSAERASWNEYQEKMAAAFAEVEELEASPGSAATRIAAWERFLEQFEVDNPYASEDEGLRELAARRIETSRSARSEPEPGELWVDPAIGMRFRYVPAGTFTMGSPEDEPGRYDGETRHAVTLTRGYWMGETEVTQGQWRGLMGNNPSRFSSCGEDCPVEQVNWFEAVVFANALSAEAGFTACYRVAGANGNKPGEDLEYESVERVDDCTGYRLPTEAEWERAARGETLTALYSGDLTIRGARDGPELDAIAWYGGNSGVSYAGGWDCSGWDEKQYPGSKSCGTHPVAQKKPNSWGLRDVLGNVYEWTWDRYGSYGGDRVDPSGPAEGTYRVFRGGSWVGVARYVRAAHRSYADPGSRWSPLGFRLARGREAEPGKP